MGRIRGGFVKVAAAVPKVSLANCNANGLSVAHLAQQAVEQGASIVLFPELTLTGCSCGHLFHQQALLQSAEQALYELLNIELESVMVVGLPISYNSRLYNCAAVIAGGTIYGVVTKSYSTDNIFTAGRGMENRYITLCDQIVPFGSDLIFNLAGVKFGVEIGSDRCQIITPSAEMASAGAVINLCLDAQKRTEGSYERLKQSVAHHSNAIAGGYAICSAGYGESSTDCVYTGNAICAEMGEVLSQADGFHTDEHIIYADFDIDAIEATRQRGALTTSCDCYRVLELPDHIYVSSIERKINPYPFIPTDLAKGCAEAFELQALGLARRLEHTHCNKAILGVSGGLDSTLAVMVVVRTFDLLKLDRKGIVGVTMPGFGTTERTYNNAIVLMQELGITLREVSIRAACEQHFKDIELDPTDRGAAYENSQARERTQILMDIANAVGGMVIGTGDLSESALGWATYNGDHMSMYNVNCSVPKTLVRKITEHLAQIEPNQKVKEALLDVVGTPVSPELLPADEKGEIAQKTEDIVGPYDLHDFFLYHLTLGASPSKILLMAEIAFKGVFDKQTIEKWLKMFLRRFFSQQYKRSALPDGPQVTAVSLSPRGSWSMPSDAQAAVWLSELE